MSDALYFAICLVSVAIGFATGRWRWAFVMPLAVWVSGVAIAALTGGFDATREDNSAGVFFFTAVPAFFWVLFAVAGTCVRRVTGARRVRYDP